MSAAARPSVPRDHTHTAGTLRPVDWATLGYLAWLTIALIVSHRRPQNWYAYIGIHIGAAMLLVTGSRNRHRLHSIVRVVHDWYPIWAIALVFEELRHLIQLVVPTWFDPLFLRADVRLFGVFPSSFLEQFYGRVLNELVMFGYFSYYFIPLAVSLPLYLRKDKRAFHQTAAGLLLAFLPCLVLFLLLPTQGPRQYYGQFRLVPLEGYLITSIEHKLISVGGLLGGAFPSSHCAVALAALLLAWRHHSRIFLVLLFIVPLLSFATVYGWYHYAVDVFAGWAVGVIAVRAAGKLYSCEPLRRWSDS